MQDYHKNLHGILSMVGIHKSFHNYPTFIVKIVALSLKYDVSLDIALALENQRKIIIRICMEVFPWCVFTKLLTIILHSLLRLLRFHLSMAFLLL